MQELSFLKISNFKYNALKKKKNMRGFFFFIPKKGSKINAWETQGTLTRTTNKKRECGHHPTGILPHIKCDGMRISGHE